ncbi:uncharacterized protein LOC144180316 [Haemaphysalis longicornis]
MQELTWCGPLLLFLAALVPLRTAQAQYVQLYGAGPEAYLRSVQRNAPAMSGAELANLLQRLLRDAALLRKRSPESGDVQDAVPPGFVGARGRRQEVILEQPPGFVGARGKRPSAQLPLFFQGLPEPSSAVDAGRTQMDRSLSSQ